jgi:predicted transcriptional regulator
MPATALEYLAASSVRPDVLAVLREHGLLSLRDLADNVSASRRTVKRTLSAMESRGWVRKVDGGYELTALGETLLSAYERFRERSRDAIRLKPFLEHVPASMVDFDIEALVDATVVSSDDDPTAITDRLVELRAGATRIREYTPYLLFDSVRQFADQVGEGQSAPDVTLVVRTNTPPQSSSEYVEGFETLVAASDADVRRRPDGPSFGFGVVDGCAFFGTTDARGMPRALLESDASELVSWAEREFERCLDASEPVSIE